MNDEDCEGLLAKLNGVLDTVNDEDCESNEFVGLEVVGLEVVGLEIVGLFAKLNAVQQLSFALTH